MEQNIERKRPFGNRDIVGYFFGDLGINMSFVLQAAYLFTFYTQYIGIRLEHWVIIIIITKIFDGVSDPIVGYLIDKIGARTQGDKFKPWIKYGGPVLAALTILMFIDSTGQSYAIKITICFVTYLAWNLAYTIVNVPYGALSSVMTNKPKERSNLSTARSWGAMMAGIALGIVIPLFIYENQVINGNAVSLFAGKNMFLIVAVLSGISLGSLMLMYYNVEERIVIKPTLDENGQVKETSMIQTIKDLSKNRPFWGLMFAVVGQLLFLMGSGQLYQLTLQMYYSNGKLTAYLSILRLVPLIFGTIFGGALVKRFGIKNVSGYPMLIAAALYIIPIFITISDPIYYLGLILIAYILGFGQMLYTWAMMSDVIDYQDYITGDRNEGSIYALYSMWRKIMQGIGSSLVPFVMTLAAPTLIVNNPLTWTVGNSESIYNLSMIFSGIGHLLVFIGLIFIYNLDEDKLKEVRTTLNNRHHIDEAIYVEVEIPVEKDKELEPSQL